MAIRTVGDLVAELLKQPQDLPVFVGCHYDNDNGLTDQVHVSNTHVEHSESVFYMDTDPLYPGSIHAVTVS